MNCWAEFLKDAQVLVSTDNEVVKDVLISCNTSTVNKRPVLCAILQSCVQSCSWSLNYVGMHGSAECTESNISDDPSRGVMKALLDDGIHR